MYLCFGKNYLKNTVSQIKIFSFQIKLLSWVLHLSLLTAEKIPNGDDITDGY